MDAGATRLPGGMRHRLALLAWRYGWAHIECDGGELMPRQSTFCTFALALAANPCDDIVTPGRHLRRRDGR